jgi:hypothetical protein
MTAVPDDRPLRGDLVTIAAGASEYEWLLALARRSLRPQPLPRALMADLGFPADADPATWRATDR